MKIGELTYKVATKNRDFCYEIEIMTATNLHGNLEWQRLQFFVTKLHVFWKESKEKITISDLRGKFEMVTSSEFRDILKIKILLLRFQILEGRWNLYMKNHDSRNTNFRDTAQKRGVYEAESKLCESTRPYSLVGMFWECMKKKQEHRNTVGARPGRTKSPQIKDTGDAQTMGPGARSVQQRKTNYEPRSSGLKNHGLPSMKDRLKSGGSSGRGNHGCVGKVRKSKKQTAGEQC